MSYEILYYFCRNYFLPRKFKFDLNRTLYGLCSVINRTTSDSCRVTPVVYISLLKLTCHKKLCCTVLWIDINSGTIYTYFEFFYQSDFQISEDFNSCTVYPVFFY